MEPKSSPVRKRTKIRPRSRRRINWPPILVTILCVNTLAACYNSRITQVRSINLDGVRASERLRVDRIVEQIKGKPALKIDPRVVESSFMNESRVKSADFRRNIFGIARLIIHDRNPVAAIDGSAHTYLDESGVVYKDLEEKSVLPQVKLENKIKVSVFALSGAINYSNVAELAQMVRSKLMGTNSPDNPIEIDVLETGGVCLNINNGTVELGTFRFLPEKIEKLKQTLADEPKFFEANSKLNLIVPENPQRVQRKKENG